MIKNSRCRHWLDSKLREADIAYMSRKTGKCQFQTRWSVLKGLHRFLKFRPSWKFWETGNKHKPLKSANILAIEIEGLYIEQWLRFETENLFTYCHINICLSLLLVTSFSSPVQSTLHWYCFENFMLITLVTRGLDKWLVYYSAALDDDFSQVNPISTCFICLSVNHSIVMSIGKFMSKLKYVLRF